MRRRSTSISELQLLVRRREVLSRSAVSTLISRSRRAIFCSAVSTVMLAPITIPSYRSALPLSRVAIKKATARWESVRDRRLRHRLLLDVDTVEQVLERALVDDDGRVFPRTPAVAARNRPLSRRL
jgi:hypothetical protein